MYLPIFAENLETGMSLRNVKSLLIAAFSLVIVFFCIPAIAQHEVADSAATEVHTSAEHHEANEGDFEPGKVIM